MPSPMSGRGPSKQQGSNAHSSPETKAEPSPRDLEIYAERKKGRVYSDIAKDFKTSKQNVYRICKKIDEWLRPQWMDEIRDVMVRQSEHLEYIFCEAMEAWEISKKDRVTITEKSGGGDSLLSEPEITIHREHNALGNKAYLDAARAALADIRKIWGAETKQSAWQGDEGEFDPTGMDREEARALYFEEQAKLHRERAARVKQLEPQAN